MLELAFRPAPTDPEPLHRQLEERLRALIAAGRLVLGQKLPATTPRGSSHGGAHELGAIVRGALARGGHADRPIPRAPAGRSLPGGAP